MAILIADTDVLIDFLAGQNPTAAQIAAELEMGTLFTTAITRFELLSGARTATQERRIRQLLDALPTLPLDTRAADRAARIRLDLERKGATIGMGIVSSPVSYCIIRRLFSRAIAVTSRGYRGCASRPDLEFQRTGIL